MAELFVHEDAQGDLDDLWSISEHAAAVITVLLEELRSDSDLLDRLNQHGYGKYETAEFEVSKWQQQWRSGKDLWRLKVWCLEEKKIRYRIIYAFMPRKHQYHVLGIVPREFNYDEDHELTQRILETYRNLIEG